MFAGMRCVFLLLIGCASGPSGETSRDRLDGNGWAFEVPKHWEVVTRGADRTTLTSGDLDFEVLREDEERTPAVYRAEVMSELPVGASSLEEAVGGGVNGLRFAWNEVEPRRLKYHRLVAISGGKRIQVTCTLPENRAVELYEACQRGFAGLTVR